MKTKAILFILASILIAADRPLHYDLSIVTAESSLDGRWQIAWIDGQDPKGTPNANLHYLFDGFALTIVDGTGTVQDTTIRVDTSKRPRTIDIIAHSGSTYLCIFERNGDDLMISWAFTPGKRPPDFSQSTSDHLMKFKRLK